MLIAPVNIIFCYHTLKCEENAGRYQIAGSGHDIGRGLRGYLTDQKRVREEIIFHEGMDDFRNGSVNVKNG